MNRTLKTVIITIGIVALARELNELILTGGSLQAYGLRKLEQIVGPSPALTRAQVEAYNQQVAKARLNDAAIADLLGRMG